MSLPSFTVEGETFDKVMQSIGMETPKKNASVIESLVYFQKIGYNTRALIKHQNGNRSAYNSISYNTLTIPNVEVFWKAGLKGVFVPKILTGGFVTPKYKYRTVDIIGYKTIRTDTTLRLIITRVGSFPSGYCVTKAARLVSLEEEFQNDQERAASLYSLWGIKKTEENDMEWCVIEWSYLTTIVNFLKLSETQTETINPKRVPLTPVPKVSNEGRVLVSGWDKVYKKPDFSDIYWTMSKELLNESRDRLLPIYAFDKTSNNNKFFVCCTYDALYKMVTGKLNIKGCPEQYKRSTICVHSTIRSDMTTKGFWDFERNLPSKTDMTTVQTMGDELTLVMLDVIIVCFKEVFGVLLSHSDFLILDASKNTKISRHVILSAPGIFFKNLAHFGNFVRVQECVMIRMATRGTPSERESVFKLFAPDSVERHSSNPLDLVTFYVEKGAHSKKTFASVFWDIGASLGISKNFRIPYATKYAEDRPLVVATMNTFEPDPKNYVPMGLSEIEEFHKLVFYSGLPTAVIKMPIDSRKLKEIGLVLEDTVLKDYINDTIRNTPDFCSVEFGEYKWANIKVSVLSHLLEESSVMLPVSSYLPAQRTSPSSQLYMCKNPLVNSLLREIMKRVEVLVPWSDISSFVIGKVEKALEPKKIKKLYQLRVKATNSKWCPILKNTHTNRKGNAEVKIYRYTGTIAINCWSSSCKPIVLKREIKKNGILKQLFQVLE